jgi:hypothetical protein
VEVSGGSLSIAQLISHLQWIVPDSEYQWEVLQMEDNVFRVNFPSKIELVRVQNFGRFHVPDSSIVLYFDFWKKEVQPVWAPEVVWVRVYGLPSVALDDYLALWTLGDVFGRLKKLILHLQERIMFFVCSSLVWTLLLFQTHGILKLNMSSFALDLSCRGCSL